MDQVVGRVKLASLKCIVIVLFYTWHIILLQCAFSVCRMTCGSVDIRYFKAMCTVFIAASINRRTNENAGKNEGGNAFKVIVVRVDGATRT